MAGQGARAKAIVTPVTEERGDKRKIQFEEGRGGEWRRGKRERGEGRGERGVRRGEEITGNEKCLQLGTLPTTYLPKVLTCLTTVLLYCHSLLPILSGLLTACTTPYSNNTTGPLFTLPR